ncbi:MAG: response regulator, partial [Desulfobacter sp.]|nr:response regulator [Desulfobacter sp.]
MTPNILVVDDEKDMTRLLQRSLEPELNCRVTMAFSGEMALNILGLADTTFDLVISDIRMPEMDGFELLEQLKQRYPDLTVVMLTAFTDADTAAQAMRDGASDYIVKPYQEAQLVSRIERALERGQLLRERAEAHDLLEQRVDEQTQTLRAQSKQLSAMLDRVVVTYQATVKALEAALDVRDQSAPGHCRRVAKLAVQLGNR